MAHPGDKAGETNTTVTCPHCHRSFWAKFGHVMKVVGITAAMVAVETAPGIKEVATIADAINDLEKGK